jgi:hypothetical protein
VRRREQYQAIMYWLYVHRGVRYRIKSEEAAMV